MSYCLAHTEFVSTIALLDDCSIVSGSGDGNIIVWNFMLGKVLFTFQCDPNFKNATDKKTNVKSNFPIKSIKINKFNGEFLAVSFYKNPIIFLFQKMTDNYSLELVCKLTLDFEPAYINFDFCKKNFLWIFGGFESKAVTLFELKNSKLTEVSHSTKIIDFINDSTKFSDLLQKEGKCSTVDTLFKHYYNNVELYYQRKILRSENRNTIISQ